MAHAKLIKIHTERSSPIPAKIRFEDSNTCHINEGDLKRSAYSETYRTTSRSKDFNETMQDFDSRSKPFCPSSIGTPRLFCLLGLLLKNSKNGTGRFAGLELIGEWMIT